MSNETNASLILIIGNLFDIRIESLLSFKEKSLRTKAAFGKCLKGVNDISEKEISPSILLLTPSRIVLLISFL
jgi:hypothetical protein